MRQSPKTTGKRQGGFTLLEVTVAAGVLFVLLTFLTQMLLNCTEVFDAGEKGQEIVQRTQAAVSPVQDALADMTGPTQRADGLTDARLVVQWMELGGKANGQMLQVLRSTVRISPQEESEMFTTELMADAEKRSEGGQQTVADILRGMILEIGKNGRADMMLLPWPQGDPEGAYIQLLRCRLIPLRPLPIREARGQHLLQVRGLGGDGIPARKLHDICEEVLATGLLHIEYQLWSQYTEGWASLNEETMPERVWDSARAGWFVDAKTRMAQFSLDIGDLSEKDPDDDVYPRKLRLTLVVGQRPGASPEAILSQSINSSEKRIRLQTADNLPDIIDGNYVKIGSEWVKFKKLRGRFLEGCDRGVRGTAAKDHDRGTGVRVGRTVRKTLALPFGRDSWNG